VISIFPRPVPCHLCARASKRPATCEDMTFLHAPAVCGGKDWIPLLPVNLVKPDFYITIRSFRFRPIIPLIFIVTDHNQYNQARHDPCHRCDFIQFQSLLDVRSGISVLLTELLPDTPLFIFSGSKVHKSCPAYLSSFHTVFFIQKYKIVAHVMVSSFCRFIKFSLCLHRSCNSHPL